MTLSQSSTAFVEKKATFMADARPKTEPDEVTGLKSLDTHHPPDVRPDGVCHRRDWTRHHRLQAVELVASE